MPHAEMPLNRRDFLRAGALGAAALTTPGLLAQPSPPRELSCIFLFLVGGPSQLETWDPKPNAPAEIRGPFGVTRTRVPGVLVSEHFPRLAGILDRITLVRSMHHDAAPIHETGHQLLQTGRLHSLEQEHPHFGAVLTQQLGGRSAILGGAIGSTGVNISHGQNAGHLGTHHEPIQLDTAPTAPTRYGNSRFGRDCFQAGQLVENGFRCVTVNMYNRLYNTVSWDCHADEGVLPTTLDDYRSVVCPQFDQAYSTLLLDLEDRGLLETTLVVAAGEFGRTPRLNLRGGRDHWPGAWSVLLAGAGLPGGRVIGATDAHAAEVVAQPITPGQLLATVYATLGVSPSGTIPGPDGQPIRILKEDPVSEILRQSVLP